MVVAKNKKTTAEKELEIFSFVKMGRRYARRESYHVVRVVLVTKSASFRLRDRRTIVMAILHFSQ